MEAPPDTKATATEGWELYWQGSGGAAFSSQGQNHPLIAAFWEEIFSAVRGNCEAPRLLDLATGSGAIVDCAYRAFGSEAPWIACLDVSPRAIRGLMNRWPAVHGLVADAAAIPFATGQFDVVTSQFGVEYAGPGAFREMLLPVAQHGRIALLLHYRSGGIYRECAAGLDAVRRVRAAGFLPLAIRMFKAGFAARRGRNRGPYEIAARQLLPAFDELEAIMSEHGAHVAGQVVMRLHRDVDRMRRRIGHHDPAEVLDWLGRMDEELKAYVERMASMCEAAIDERRFLQLCQLLRNSGYEIQRAEPLQERNRQPPLAWSLLATRS
jgi:SAM-dependent methyltransferase